MSGCNNVVLIGAGMVAAMHARAIADAGLALHGLLSRDPIRARAFAETHAPGIRIYGDLGQVIADPRVGFVILATPPDARGEFIAPLARAGIPILCEKPLERDAPRARALVEICEAAGVPLGVILQHRMRPAAQTLLARVRAGDLGRIASVEVRLPWWRDQGYYDAPGRGTYARDGGGVLITQGIHIIDLMGLLCGPVARVQAITATTALHAMEAEDFAAAGLIFASGAVGSLMASTTHFPGGTEEITLNGTLASAHLGAARLSIRHHDGHDEVIGATASTGGGADPMAFTPDWHRAVIADFAAALTENRAPTITGRSALAAQELIDAIAASARSGHAVDLAQGGGHG